MYFKTTEQANSLSMLSEPLFFLPHRIQFQKQASSDGRIQQGEAKSEAFRSTLVYVLLQKFAFAHIFTEKNHTRSHFNHSTFDFLIKIFFI